MTIMAKFTGTSSSVYRNGYSYILTLDDKQGMSIQKERGEGYTEYESLSAFLNNWDDIKHVR